MVKIVSGGQTGVDRAALDAALAAGVECGGWCPEGRKAEDGEIPAHYPLAEIPGGGYPERTERNVLHSDGTLILTFGPPTGGTKLTLDYCREEERPCLVIDARITSLRHAVKAIAAFVAAHHIHTLNVAGPRASAEPVAYRYAFDVLTAFLKQ